MEDELSASRPVARWRSRLAAAQEGRVDGRSAREAWLRIWRASWPAREHRAHARLESLIARLLAEERSLLPLAAGTELPGREAWSRRRALAAELARRLHADLLGPAAVFDALLLEALELERLRAELVRRALLAAEGA